MPPLARAAFLFPSVYSLVWFLLSYLKNNPKLFIMNFICWLLIGALSASIGFIALDRKGYPAVGLLFIMSIGCAVLAGWWATQLGWEWGDAIAFNYRNILVATVADLFVVPVTVVLLNVLFPSENKQLPMDV